MSTCEVQAAMVLAAGRGERMWPLTSVMPKPALPLPDGPVIASALRLAAASGANRVVVNACHLADRMADAVAEVAVDEVEVVLSLEDELMGTAGGIARARDRGFLGDSGSVLVMNGDCALGLDLRAIVEHHLASDNLVTLALLPHLDPTRWSRVVLDTGGLVTTIKPPGQPDSLEVPLLYPGVMAVSREALNSLPTAPGGVPATLWSPAQSTGRLGGFVVSGHWREVGTPTDYLEVMLDRLAGSKIIVPSAAVGNDVTIVNSYVGRDAVIGDGAIVKDSVIAEGAVIGTGARVEKSVLLGAVEIGPDQPVAAQILAQQRSNV